MAPPTASSRDRFVTLPENRSALRAVRRLARRLLLPDSRKPSPSLFLHGPPGSGKSHLANGLVEQVAAAPAGLTAQVIAAVDLGRLLIEPPDPSDDPRR